MSMEKRSFHLGDILSVSTPYLLSPRHVEGVYDILNFLTGDELFTHQLPRAQDECRPHVLRQLPFLAEIDMSGTTPDNYKERMASMVETYGEYHDLSPIPQDDHARRNPIEELLEMMPGKDVIVVEEGDQP